ncbi:MAG: hypothetical protein WBF75_24885 [Pseudonocardiaceae bacterium]
METREENLLGRFLGKEGRKKMSVQPWDWNRKENGDGGRRHHWRGGDRRKKFHR